MNLDRIKDRIRKLLNVAADDAASDGEIANAITAARNLMHAYQLEEADCELQQEKKAHGRRTASTNGTRATYWEGQLAHFVCDLVGGVQCYNDRSANARVEGGTVKRCKAFTFYGLDEEAKLAAETYEELVATIATMAKLKFGGWYRGDGAMYAEGFVQGLNQQIAKADEEAMKTETGTALVVRSQELIEAKKAEGSRWLEDVCKIKLRAGSRRTGSTTGSFDALKAGRADGRNANLNGVGQRRKKIAQ